MKIPNPLLGLVEGGPAKMRLVLDRALDRLLPPTCVLCGAPGADGLDLCAGCLGDLPMNLRPCPRCAMPVPMATAGLVCGACLSHPPPYQASHIPYLYVDAIPGLVRGAKFHGRLNLTRLLGLCLARSLVQMETDRPEILIPVPLHPQRWRERGYNQAQEMAQALSSRLAIPIDTQTCVRLHANRPQVGLERDERRLNVRGAFGASRIIPAKHIAILDDVVTTGSTAAEVARVLRQAGAERVDLWAVARAPGMDTGLGWSDA
mgnify:CR=1 FL=1